MRRLAPLSPRLVRVTLAGDELDGFTVTKPAASVRLLIPERDTTELVVPAGTATSSCSQVADDRPSARSRRAVRIRRHCELDLDIVVHGGGAASIWVDRVSEGSAAAISGPGRGYDIDATAPAFLLAGDETAIPAMSQLLEHLPPNVPRRVLIEVADPDALLIEDDPLHAVATWVDLREGAQPGDALFEAIAAVPIAAGEKIWIAGEAAAMQRIRRHLFDERGVTRRDATVRGYWKHGRAGRRPDRVTVEEQLSVDDRGVDERLQLAAEVERARRHQLRHEHDDELLGRVHPERRRCRAAHMNSPAVPIVWFATGPRPTAIVRPNPAPSNPTSP